MVLCVAPEGCEHSAVWAERCPEHYWRMVAGCEPRYDRLGCAIQPASSRACERGTKSCVAKHDARQADRERAQRFVGSQLTRRTISAEDLEGEFAAVRREERERLADAARIWLEEQEIDAVEGKTLVPASDVPGLVASLAKLLAGERERTLREVEALFSGLNWLCLDHGGEEEERIRDMIRSLLPEGTS